LTRLLLPEITRLGPEQPKKSRQKTQIATRSGAKSGACGAQNNDLGTVIEAWPTLPPALRAGIVAMVKAATT
jgi:hypothetical protein